MLRDMNLPDVEGDPIAIELWRPLPLVRPNDLCSAGTVETNRMEMQECTTPAHPPLAPCTCPQRKRILLTFGIIGVREVAAVLWTSYKCTPEGTTHFPFLKSWQIDMKLHASFLEGLFETCVVDFIVV